MKNIMYRFSQLINENELDVPKTRLTETKITDVLQIVFGIAAAVAVLIIAISALRMVVSRGNSQDVTQARDAIVYASVGLIITLAAFAIVTFVVERV
ncbi:MAG: hypothetical protein M3Q14_04790 [bacterium]|nr:hypothetical protein [bacterium]